MDEQEAIRRLCCGQVDGLEVLVRAYQVQAVRTAYVVTRDLPLAQDIVQDAFIKAYRRIHQYDPTRPFGPWFLTIVLHDAIRAAKRQDHHRSLDSIAADDSSPRSRPVLDDRPGPEELWEKAETTDEVWSAIEQLSPTQRAVVVARYFLGLSEAEAAESLVCPPGTIKWRLHAARQRLRLLLSPSVPKSQAKTEGNG